jgi:catechol 2,3-dioxygenase-like lactoylglutathione lyase family enzyme
MVSAIFTAIYVEDLKTSEGFYHQLLGLETTFESDWIIQLSSTLDESLSLTLQPRHHDLVPPDFRKPPQGVSVAFVVPDTDAVYEKALTMGLQIVQTPKNEIYGQRRFLTTDPDGLLIDVSTPCEPSEEFRAKYMSED